MANPNRTDNQNLLDYLARDYDSLLQSMLEQVPAKLPEWKDARSEADFGRVLLELFAHMGDILGYYQDRVAGESFLATAKSRRSVIQHLGLIGYRLATAAPAAARLTLTAPAVTSAIVTIRKGDAFATKSAKDRPSVRFEYTREENLVLDFSAIPVDPVTGKKIAPEAVPVEEGRRYASELTGISDGSAHQVFTLVHPELILRPIGSSGSGDLQVRTELGEGAGKVIEPWFLRESLAFSRDGQRDFSVAIDDMDRASLRFGDGSFGAIPPTGSKIFASYRVGGGIKGNVPPGSIQTVLEAPALALLGIKVSNPAAATAGADRETIGHAAFLAPSAFRSQNRAVTVGDYQALALEFKGVGKVRAEIGNWNRVYLYVAPEGGGFVSDTLAARLLDYFEDKRPVSTRIEIRDVDYVSVYVRAKVGLGSYYSRGESSELIAKAVRELLAFDNVDFAQTVFLSKFYEAIEAIQGVEYAVIEEFRRSGEAPGSVSPSGKLALSANEIPTIPADIPSEAAYAGGLGLILEGGY